VQAPRRGSQRRHEQHERTTIPTIQIALMRARNPIWPVPDSDSPMT